MIAVGMLISGEEVMDVWKSKRRKPKGWVATLHGSMNLTKMRRRFPIQILGLAVTLMVNLIHL